VASGLKRDKRIQRAMNELSHSEITDVQVVRLRKRSYRSSGEEYQDLSYNDPADNRVLHEWM
jgi:hypothetical protein